MPDPTQSNDLVLGQLLGKTDGILTAMKTFSETFAAHALTDKEAIASISKQMADDKTAYNERLDKDRDQMSADRLRIAQWTGGIVALGTLLSILVPILLPKLLN